jgi:hypothetical protein
VSQEASSSDLDSCDEVEVVKDLKVMLIIHNSNNNNNNNNQMHHIALFYHGIYESSVDK